MSRLLFTVQGVFVATLVILGGVVWLNATFADRIPLRTRIGLFPIGGLEKTRVLQALDLYELEFAQTKTTIELRGNRSTRTFEELGIRLNKEETAKKIQFLSGYRLHVQRQQIIPVLKFQDEIAHAVLQQDFANTLVVPENATLVLNADNTIRALPPKNGEHINMNSFRRDITEGFSRVSAKVISASVVQAVPEQNSVELEKTKLFAQSLIQNGLQLVVQDRIFQLPGRIVSGMMFFTHDAIPAVALDDAKLSAYIVEHIVKEVQQDPVNARFQMKDGKVDQFSLPQDGKAVNIEETLRETKKTLALRLQVAPLVMQIVSPLISDTGDSEKLGITKLLAVGETDFKGSPKNRTVNIGVGTSKYNGILIAPNEEFSFNAFLGPVNKEAGYLPELVIKNKTTTPEYGGGLCQVSTTAFRAAVFAGMQITSRRNHSYAVRYYGTPGFDATIYPPYTDFRFLNNSPGYILIQSKIEGTKLLFEFWGTDDNRVVVVDGPSPYGKMPDGAVKSVLKQTVTKDGATIVEDTFYSNYKSPNLFPHT
ncbi:MAG: VanW family protein [bacterium]|nr:VanW family protein [bacterium]